MKIANLGKRTFKILTKIKRETYQNLKCKRVQNLNSGVDPTPDFEMFFQ